MYTIIAVLSFYYWDHVDIVSQCSRDFYFIYYKNKHDCTFYYIFKGLYSHCEHVIVEKIVLLSQQTLTYHMLSS